MTQAQKDRVIYCALVEYEENNYEYEDNEWQRQVNKLIEEYRKKING